MRRPVKASLLLCAAGAMLGACCLFSACNNSGDPAPEEKLPTTYVAVDVNPSVEMVLDQHDSVMSVTGVNADARVLLYNDSGIVGENISDALAHLLTIADESNMLTTNIGVSVYSSDPDGAPRVYDSMDKTVADLRLASGTRVTDEHAVDLALSYEQSSSADQAVSGMSLERYRLVKRVSQYSDVSLASAAAMSDSALISTVRDVQADSDTKLGKLYDRAVTEAKFALESATRTAKDSLYPLYFANKTFDEGIFNLLTNSRHWTYANVYVALHSLSLNLNHYYSALSEYLRDPVFTLDDFKAAFEGVSQFFKDAVTDIFGKDRADENGEITAEVINAELSGIYRSLPASQRAEFAAEYASLRQSVLNDPPVEKHITYAAQDENGDQVESSGFDRLKQEIADAFNAIKNDIGNSEFLQKVKEWTSDIIEELGLSDLFASIGDKLEETFANVDFAKLFDVKRAIERVDEATDKAYEKMELTSDDLDGIAALETNIGDQLKAAKESFEGAVADAKRAATEWFEDSKSALGI